MLSFRVTKRAFGIRDVRRLIIARRGSRTTYPLKHIGIRLVMPARRALAACWAWLRLWGRDSDRKEAARSAAATQIVRVVADH